MDVKGNNCFSKKKHAKVSTIIVTWNCADYIVGCLESLRDHCDAAENHIIIVDNASIDPTVELVKQNEVKVDLIESPENLGFAKACNLGAANTESEYLLFLNPDTILLNDAIKTLADFLDSHKDTGVVGGKVLNPDGTLQPPCRRRFPTIRSSVMRLFGLSKLFPAHRWSYCYEMSMENADRAHEVDAVSGSFFIIRRSLFNELGGFDEDFFIFGEDLDLCYRAKMKGWKIYYNPEAKVIHYRGKSRVLRPVSSLVDTHKAMLLFYDKHYRHNRAALVNLAVRWAIYARLAVLVVISYIHSLIKKLKVI